MDLPLILAALVVISIMLYVLLEGMDLGVGVLTGLSSSEEERALMTETLKPVWRGGAVWLALAVLGLYAGFPLAFDILFPAFCVPAFTLIAALVIRAVSQLAWSRTAHVLTKRACEQGFFIGSLVAALSQGFILGGYVQGLRVEDTAFAGGLFDWLSPFTLLVAASVVVGYALLGGCWLVLKTEGELYLRARRWARLSLIGVGCAFAAVSLAMLSVDPDVSARWGFSLRHIDWATLLPLSPIPLAGLLLTLWLFRDLWMTPGPDAAPDWRPYLLAAGVFLSGFFGLTTSIFPFIIPYEVRLWGAAANDETLAVLLIGAAVLTPTILIYTAYVYRLFWGKVTRG